MSPQSMSPQPQPPPLLLLLLLMLLLMLVPLGPAAAECPRPYISKDDMFAILPVNAEQETSIKCYVYAFGPSNDSCSYDIKWYKDGVEMQFRTDGTSELSNYLRLRGKKRLRIDRAVPELGGNYSCRIVDEWQYPSSCRHALSCYRPESIRTVWLKVEPSAQPSTAAFMSNFPPARFKDMKKGRLYLSRRISEMQAPTVRRDEEQKQKFQLRLVLKQRRGGEAPTVSWHRELPSGRIEPLSAGLYRVQAPTEYRCTRQDTLFRRGRFRAKRLRCFVALMWIAHVNATTAGRFLATARLGDFELSHPFRVDCGDCRLRQIVIRFNKNTSVCLGDSLTLDCEVSPASTVQLSSLGDGRLRALLEARNSTTLGRYDPNSASNARIGNMSVRLVSVGEQLHRVAVRLGNFSKAQQGFYACFAQPSDPRYAADYQTAYVTVRRDCVIGPATVPAQLYAGVGMLASLTLVATFSIGICAYFVVRRRAAPVVKRLRLVRHEPNSELYRRHRAATDTPLLGDQAPVGCQTPTLVVPDIVVERVGGGSGANSQVSDANKEVRYVIPSCPVLEIDRKKVSFFKQIGQGAFGSVHSGQIHCSGRTRDVAIKRLKHDYTEEELVALVKEMEIMRMMSRSPHPNIIKLVGVCTRSGPFLLLVELAHHGNLRDFLKDRAPAESEKPPPYFNVKPDSCQVMVMPTVASVQLLKFCEHVASALNFMASINIVHRDIAARNILVDGCESGDGLVAKVADFGLTRNTQDKDYYRVITEGKLPVKWLAPECLHSRIFSTKSDVWAYGILLYEIFTFGEVPYPGVSPSCVHQYLQDGRLNSRPQYASEQMYKLMLDCWAYDPSMRPGFCSLLHRIRAMRMVAEL